MAKMQPICGIRWIELSVACQLLAVFAGCTSLRQWADIRAVSAADCHAPLDDGDQVRRNEAAEHLLAAEGL